MKASNIININLGELFRSLIEQWKTVAVAGVVTALLVPCALSIKDNRAAEANANALARLAELSEDERLDTLSDARREQVVYALTQARLIEAQDEYNQNSVLAQMDMSDLPVLHCNWVITGDADKEAVYAAYRTRMTEPGIDPVVRSALDASYSELEDVYVNELVSVKSDDSIDLCIALPEGTDVEVLSAGVKEYAGSVQDSLKSEFGAFELHLLTCEETCIVDGDRAAERILNDDNLKILKNNYNSLRLSFWDDQLMVLDSLIYGIDPQDATYTDPGIQFSAKRIIVGFAVGVLLYIFCYFVYIVFSSKIKSSNVMSETFGIRYLGTASKYIYKGLFFFAHCKILYTAFRKKTVDGKSLDGIADSVVTYMKHNDCSKLLVVRSGIAKDHYDVSDKLIAKIKKAGIDVKKTDGELNDSSLTDADSVVVLAGNGFIKYSELERIVSSCECYAKKIVGGVWFD